MKLDWIIEAADEAKLKAFFAKHCECRFVRDRIDRNLALRKAPISKEKFWEIHVGCLLTTQQKAGPKSAVTRFMTEVPFRLAYNVCQSKNDAAAFCRSILEDFGGLRRYRVISGEAAENLKFLESGGWQPSLEHLDIVRRHPTPQNERLAANFFETSLKGFGPKQSRNLLQWLGLSKFETPIDSRVADWLNKFGFPFKLTAKALASRDIYELAADGFQKLAAACELAPCVLDAAIFASYDGEELDSTISAENWN